jgi:enoyl-[acyl-carrier protein] reductase II
MAAAFALGAEGVQLGTRFVATEECIAHPRYKEAILQAGDTDTTITSRVFMSRRSLKTGFTRQLMELDRSGATAEEIRAFLGYRRARAAQLDGDLDKGETYAGSSVGLISDISPAAKVIERLINEYKETITRLVNGE